jgi:hypothetical protein
MLKQQGLDRVDTTDVIALVIRQRENRSERTLKKSIRAFLIANAASRGAA